MKSHLPFIADVKLDNHATNEMHISYVNSNEPSYSKHFFVQLSRFHKEDNWSVEHICVYNTKHDRFESVKGMYSKKLVEEIKYTLLTKIKENNKIPSLKEVI